MDARKRQVLEALIDDYIVTAEPVGSRTLARKYNLGVSSATIRNEMADLEELGFLEQPHTSSGRVPTDSGYRFYVDQLMTRSPLDWGEREMIHQAFQMRVRELHWFIHQTARLISTLTLYPALVVAPPAEHVALVDVSFVPIGKKSILMVLRTDNGLVEHQTFMLPQEFEIRELARLADEFSREFRGTLIKDLRSRMLDAVSSDLSRYQTLWQFALKWMSGRDGDEDKVSLAGPLHILNYPEFRDVDKVRRVLGFLEHETEIDRLVHRNLTDEVQVVIGAESSMEDIQDCSVVTATYKVGKNVVGHLLVLGPRRMQYGRVMSIVEAVSHEMSRILNG